MVYLYYTSCLRYTILVRNPQYILMTSFYMAVYLWIVLQTTLSTYFIFLSYISRVSDQNGISLQWYRGFPTIMVYLHLCINMLEIHHSGQEPSIFSWDIPFWSETLNMHFNNAETSWHHFEIWQLWQCKQKQNNDIIYNIWKKCLKSWKFASWGEKTVICIGSADPQLYRRLASIGITGVSFLFLGGPTLYVAFNSVPCTSWVFEDHRLVGLAVKASA